MLQGEEQTQYEKRTHEERIQSRLARKSRPTSSEVLSGNSVTSPPTDKSGQKSPAKNGSLNFLVDLDVGQVKWMPQKTSPGLEGLFDFHVQEAEIL